MDSQWPVNGQSVDFRLLPVPDAEVRHDSNEGVLIKGVSPHHHHQLLGLPRTSDDVRIIFPCVTLLVGEQF